MFNVTNRHLGTRTTAFCGGMCATDDDGSVGAAKYWNVERMIFFRHFSCVQGCSICPLWGAGYFENKYYCPFNPLKSVPSCALAKTTIWLMLKMATQYIYEMCRSLRSHAKSIKCRRTSRRRNVNSANHNCKTKFLTHVCAYARHSIKFYKFHNWKYSRNMWTGQPCLLPF